MKRLPTILAALLCSAAASHADTFGISASEFAIDFVTIGNPGNGDDVGAGGGIYMGLSGGVPYTYRMGMYEISQDQIDKATASGMAHVTAGAWTGSKPAANMTWYEAAAFVNWLNTTTGHQAAYNLTYTGGWTMNLWSSAQAWQFGGENLYRHKDAYYFLPSLDEWYKAAFHKNDGVTGNYWDYATGSNSFPTPVASGTAAGTAVYDTVSGTPAAVNNAGGSSPYGTMGQTGNVFEWNETAYDGLNNIASKDRTTYGGSFVDPEYAVRATARGWNHWTDEGSFLGFRVASVPEPSATVLLCGAGLAWLVARRRRAG